MAGSPTHKGQGKSPLKVLHLEDNPNDAELVHSLLAQEGIICEIVQMETQEEFVAGLERPDLDLILSDFSLPSFDGLTALTLTQLKRPEIPFIFVSGTLGEESAVTTLQCGATDYILKQRLTRLPAAVRRALREAQEKAERKRLEEQLRQAQKMEAIGHLAGGIAHDFNNLLTVIIGYTQLVWSSLPKSDPLRSELDQIKFAARRAATLTGQLLAFSRQQMLAPKVLDLNTVLINLEPLLRRLIGEDITLDITPDPALGPIKADPSQVEQVIMNLAVNGRDAMPRGGHLIIETKGVELNRQSLPAESSLQPGRYVLLTVRDTGHGMNAETQARIFEPFFTTKGPGKGTGLGLSTVYGIVMQSGGQIRVSSEPDNGTAFFIYFPRVAEELGIADADLTQTADVRGTETILLVEDEEMIRGLARTIFHTHGYHLLEARDGQEALQIAEQHQRPIHLVITDMVMPGMGGRELGERLRASRPETKLLYMSGYTDDTIIRHGGLDPGLAFIQKPFTPEDLIRKVLEVLMDQPGRPDASPHQP